MLLSESVCCCAAASLQLLGSSLLLSPSEWHSLAHFLTLPCLHAICPCGLQRSETQADSLTQPRGQRVTPLWTLFSTLSAGLCGPGSDEEGRMMLLQIVGEILRH